jgi:hypothetical protein
LSIWCFVNSCCTEGNERADRLAKAGTGVEEKAKEGEKEIVSIIVEDVECPTTSVSIIQEYKGSLIAEWGRLWKEGTTGKRLKKIDHHPPSPHTLRLYSNLSRRHCSLLTQLRTSKSQLNADLFRIGVSKTNECECNEIESREHFLLSCPLYRSQRLILNNSICPSNSDLSSLLTNRELLEATLKFIDSTNRFPPYKPTSAAKVKGKGKKEKKKKK